MIHRIGRAELAKPRWWIGGHAKQQVTSCGKSGLVVAKIADLSSAAWRKRLGKEVDDHRMPAQASKADQLFILVLQLQLGGLVAWPQNLRHRKSLIHADYRNWRLSRACRLTSLYSR